MKSSKELFNKSIDKAVSEIPSISGEIMKNASELKSKLGEEEVLKGGLADKKNLEDIAKKHNVSLEEIEKEFSIGVQKEKEHTKDEKESEEIAKDHLWEDPKYYDKLSKIEKKETKEGDSNQNEKDMIDGIIEIVKQVKDLTNRKSIAKNMMEKLKKEKVDFDHNKFLELCGIKKEKNSETKEATGSGSSGAYSAPLFGGDDEFTEKSDSETPKKVEAKEATGSGSVGAYESPAMWAKSTKKKDWRGKSKTQIPGGAFVSVKKKCTKFPYCNKGDINALHIYKNESLKEAIINISKQMSVNENTIKAILEYEYEKVVRKAK
jgi:hypothetical protein